MTEGNLNETEPVDQHKDDTTATLTEAERIAALQKRAEEQETLNSALTQELEGLKTQMKEKAERDAARRKKLDPKNLVFNSPVDVPEESGDEEKTPERDGTESESDEPPPHVHKGKQDKGGKGTLPDVTPINLGDPISSGVTPESLAEILKQILANQGGLTQNGSPTE